MSSARHPAALAASAAVTLVATRPFLPVNALAFPELTTSALARPDLMRVRHQSTAADGHFDRVKTPATAVPGSSSASRTSVRPTYRMPAAAVATRTPPTSGISGKHAGASGDTAVDITPNPKPQVSAPTSFDRQQRAFDSLRP